jgi:EAL domain-containing protein (putative c-di-GMP-specific phosphodiesterase class I)
VAEGVETADQVDELKMLGCHIGQGTLVSAASR